MRVSFFSFCTVERSGHVYGCLHQAPNNGWKWGVGWEIEDDKFTNSLSFPSSPPAPLLSLSHIPSLNFNELEHLRVKA